MERRGVGDPADGKAFAGDTLFHAHAHVPAWHTAPPSAVACASRMETAARLWHRQRS
ncbi:hypothetical protein [Streptomyces sp. R35]|uniref:Uncharacterized protein n=1 Tax=Streptomyces sp. R35 TaxID=3238630 RepID=A0AB39S3G1_9ACTN